MISVHLDDLKIDALRRVAAEQGVPTASTATQTELIAAIKLKVSPEAALVLAPIPAATADKKGWRSPQSIVSILSVLVAISAVSTTWYGVISATRHLTEEIQSDEKKKWQAVRVYDIIATHTALPEKRTGLTFAEIKSQYTEEGLTTGRVRLEKSDLQSDELLRVVTELISSQLVFRTTDEKFVVSKHGIQPLPCIPRPTTDETRRTILRLLSTDPGKLTVEILSRKVLAEGKVLADECYDTINCMTSSGIVIIDNRGMVWPVTEAWPKEMPKTADVSIKK